MTAARLLAIASIGVACTVLPQAAVCVAPAPPSILRDGSFHEGEAPLQPGTGWFALRAAGGQWVLSATRVTATRVRDTLVDSDEGGISGVEIKSQRGQSTVEAVALLRHTSLRAGAVPGIVWAQPEDDEPRRLLRPEEGPQQFGLGARNYRIELRRIEPAGEGQPNAEIRVTGQGDRPVLLDKSWHGEDNMVIVAWAGDLNGDGLPDFVISHEGYNRENFCWYLSTPGGTRYQKIGCQETTGC